MISVDLQNRILSYQNELKNLVNEGRSLEDSTNVVIRELNAEKLVRIKNLEPNSFLQLKGNGTEYVTFCLPDGDASKCFGVLLFQNGDTLKDFFAEKQLKEVHL